MVEQMANAVMTAFARIVNDKRINPDIDKAVASMKKLLLERYKDILAEMKEAADCNMGEPMLRSIMAANCTQIAIDTLKEQALL